LIESPTPKLLRHQDTKRETLRVCVRRLQSTERCDVDTRPRRLPGHGSVSLGDHHC